MISYLLIKQSSFRLKITVNHDSLVRNPSAHHYTRKVKAGRYFLSFIRLIT